MTPGNEPAPRKSRAAAVMSGRAELAALNAMTSLLSFALPEREPHAKFYERTETVLDMIGETDAWPLAYLQWEMVLLDDMGFGLDLSECAVLGAGANDLYYVSPKTGRAVSRAGAGDWADRLLPLPPALLGEGEGDYADVAEGLKTTGHFLARRVAAALGDGPIPEARRRFEGLVVRQG